MISYDDSYVYVDSEAFEYFCMKNNAAGDVFIVFGGFHKLPGFFAGENPAYMKQVRRSG